MSNFSRDDQILPITRWVAILVFPILVTAFVILYFFPQLSGERFAWQIRPNLMAVYMGAGYLGGSIVFLQTAVGRRWHRVSAGFLPVTAFTIAMLLATVLHWSRFDLGHLPFQLWLVLYVVTPFLIPWLWWNNQHTDPGTSEPGEVFVPQAMRWGLRLLGAGILLVSGLGIVFPQFMINVWPWVLTPLTARVLAGWGALLGVGNLVMSLDSRWSSWRTGAASIAIWHLFFLLGAYLHREDFTGGVWLNWYTFSVISVLLLIGGLAVYMERQRLSR